MLIARFSAAPLGITENQDNDHTKAEIVSSWSTLAGQIWPSPNLIVLLTCSFQHDGLHLDTVCSRLLHPADKRHIKMFTGVRINRIRKQSKTPGRWCSHLSVCISLTEVWLGCSGCGCGVAKLNGGSGLDLTGDFRAEG